MTPQEKELITTLLDRLRNAGGQPKDAEADALIRQALAAQPDAPYYLVQTVLIQDLALHNAQNRITQLEQQVTSAQQEAAKPTSFLGSLFGRPSTPPPPPAPAGAPPAGPWSRGPQAAPPPPPGYGHPSYGPSGTSQPGAGPTSMLGGSGGGFLRSAAATAAGVAGGALLFQGIESLFGRREAGGLLGGQPMAPGLGETVINNYYGSDAGYGGDAGGVGGGPDFGASQDYSGGQDQDFGSNQDFSGNQDQDFGSDQDFSGDGGDFGGTDQTC